MNELTPITLDESRRPVELEKTIEHGLKTFLEVGAALAEIRDKKLYRVEYSTFEAYCRDKWKISDRRARQLIDSVAIVESLDQTGTQVPVSEAQVRPLASLEPKKRAEAFALTVELAKGNEPTRDQVAQAVAQISQKPDVKVSAPEPELITVTAYVSNPKTEPQMFRVRIIEPDAPKVAPLIVHSSVYQTFRVENPLPTWHVARDAHLENEERIVCTHCWSHSSGLMDLEGGLGFYYSCHCENSERTAVLKKEEEA